MIHPSINLQRNENTPPLNNSARNLFHILKTRSKAKCTKKHYNTIQALDTQVRSSARNDTAKVFFTSRMEVTTTATGDKTTCTAKASYTTTTAKQHSKGNGTKTPSMAKDACTTITHSNSKLPFVIKI